MMQKQKNKQKGITLIALVVTIIVLIILAGVSINMLVGDNGIITQAQMAKEETEQTRKEELQELATLETALEEASGNIYIKEEGVNKPRLTTGMTPIKFIEPTNTTKGSVVITTSEDKDWYQYDEKKWANAQTEDGSMWVWIPRFAYRVNESTKTFDVVFLIGTTDTYYDENGQIQTAKRCTSEDEVVDTNTGYTVHPAFTDETDINFRNGGWDKEITGIWVAKFEAGYASGNNGAEVVASSVNYSQSNAWIRSIELHGNTTTGDGNGNARNWLDGIYESTTTAIKYPVFQPTTYGMNYININDAYNIAKVLTENGNIYGFNGAADSHLMKNSEWGACAYLSKSQYGLNTIDIAINNITLNSGAKQRTEAAGQNEVDSVYAVTGCTTGNTTGEKQTTIENINATTGNTALDGVYTWDQLNGIKASCTGTIYGIYDLSGGLVERTTGYVANGKKELKNYGASFTYEDDVLKTVSTKYATVYINNNTTDNASVTDTQEHLNIASTNNWLANKLIYGDAIRETSTQGTGNNSWYEDDSYFPGLYYPFTIRGGSFRGMDGPGLFNFSRTNAPSHYGDGFRAVVVVL